MLSPTVWPHPLSQENTDAFSISNMTNTFNSPCSVKDTLLKFDMLHFYVLKTTDSTSMGSFCHHAKAVLVAVISLPSRLKIRIQTHYYLMWFICVILKLSYTFSTSKHLVFAVNTWWEGVSFFFLRTVQRCIGCGWMWSIKVCLCGETLTSLS